MTHSHIAAGILGLSAFVCSVNIVAQDGGEALETITVTVSNISYRDFLDTPAVSVTRPGDYLLLPITLM